MSDVKYPDIEVPLSYMGGNVYSIIHRVSRAIKYQYGDEAAEEFRAEATSQKSYDDVIQLVMRTVETT